MSPSHPYTASLIAALPRMGVQIPTAVGRADVGFADSGCSFRMRCPIAVDACSASPELMPIAGREVSCFRANDIIENRKILNAQEASS